MPLRFISVPEPIEVKIEKQSKNFSFEEFIETILAHPSWGKSYSTVRAAAAIEAAVHRRTDSGQEVAVAEGDWQLLVDLLKDPPNGGLGLNPLVARQTLPFFEAVISAEGEKGTATTH